MGLEKLAPWGIGLNAGMGMIGLLQSGAANKRNQQLISQQQNLIDREYLPDMNRRYLDTEQAQSFLATLRDRLIKNNQRVDQTAAVTGGTDEAALAGRQAAANTYAQYLNQLSAQGTMYKQGLKDRYVRANGQLAGMRYQQNQGASQSGSNLFSNAMKSVGSLALSPLLGGGAEKGPMDDPLWKKL